MLKNLWRDPAYNERVSKAISISQKAAWSDPEKKAIRLSKFHTDEYRDAISKATSGKNNPRYDPELYDFVSPEGEVITSTQMEICIKFKLDRSHITKLCKGKALSHKGWTLKKAPD